MLPGQIAPLGMMAETSITYVGSVSAGKTSEDSWDSSGEAAPDIMSIAQTGDLVVIALSFENNGDSSWSWNGMTFTDVYDQTGADNPGAYVGYRFVEAGDANPYVTGVTLNNWYALSIVASVFRGVSSYLGATSATGVSGMPNPPSHTDNGKLWIATGHLDDDLAESSVAAQSGYTLGAAKEQAGGTRYSTTMLSYKIDSLASDDPAAFGGTGTDEWRAVTAAFD